MTGWAQTDQVLELVLLAAGPRDNVCNFYGNLMARRDRAPVPALNQDGSLQFSRNVWSLDHPNTLGVSRACHRGHFQRSRTGVLLLLLFILPPQGTAGQAGGGTQTHPPSDFHEFLCKVPGIHRPDLRIPERREVLQIPHGPGEHGFVHDADGDNQTPRKGRGANS